MTVRLSTNGGTIKAWGHGAAERPDPSILARLLAAAARRAGATKGRLIDRYA